MTRAEADALFGDYEDAAAEYRITIRLSRDLNVAPVALAFTRMNQAREKCIDAMCGEVEEAPVTGTCGYCGRPENSAGCQGQHP